MRRLWWIIGCLLIAVSPLWAGSAMFSWQAPTQNADGTPLLDLAGHKAFWGTASGSYSTEVDVGMATNASFANLPDGQIIYFAAQAYDTSGNHSIYSVEVTKRMPGGDTTAPTVSITSPAHGATVPRRMTTIVIVDATDNVGVVSVSLAVNDSLIYCTGTGPYTCAWRVPAANRRSYTLQAAARDAATNTGVSPLVEVKAE